MEQKEKNWNEGLKFIINNINEELTEEFILKLHEILLKNIFPESKIGKYKECINHIKGRNTCPPELIHEKIQQLLYYYNNEEEKDIVSLEQFHVLFGWLHPFIDGNGRVIRLLTFKESIKNGLIPIYIDNDLNTICSYAVDKYFEDSHLLDNVFIYAQKQWLKNNIQLSY